MLDADDLDVREPRALEQRGECDAVAEGERCGADARQVGLVGRDRLDERPVGRLVLQRGPTCDERAPAGCEHAPELGRARLA